ncbi:hypothetical protein JCM33374_g4090 [Metschnikowia sp. JCM 33374]|nr:hypothetical protein JCM33374_g4090 [Metschnikowia sp. JCM 33374]
METTQEVSSHAIESHSPNCGVNRLQLSNSVDASLDVEQCIISPLGETSSTKATVEEASIKPALFSHLPQLDSTETTQALVPHSLSQIKVARKTCIPEQTSPMSNRPTSIPTTHDQQIIQDANRTFAKLYLC